MSTRFFRAGVGTVIYNKKGEVAIFERTQHPVGVWQFQQGGVDLDEDINATLWRELKEEVGLQKEDFDQIIEFPEWTIMPEPKAICDPSKSRLGQVHRWFFLQLKTEVCIDLSKATEYEASNYRWSSFVEVLDLTEDYRKPAYNQLQEFFTLQVIPNIKV